MQPDNLALFVVLPFYLVILLLLVDRRYSLWKSFLVLAGGLLAAGPLIPLILFIFPYHQMVWVLYLIGPVVSVLFAFALSRQRDGRAFCSGLTAAALVWSMDLLGNVLEIFYGDGCPAILLFIKFIFCLLYGLMVYRYFKTPFQSLLHRLEKGWYCLSILPLSFLGIFFLVGSYPAPLKQRPENIPAAIFSVTALFATSFLIHLLFQLFDEQFRATQERDLLLIQMESLRSHEKGEERLRIYRHDLRHFTRILQSQLCEGRVEEALTTLGTMDSSFTGFESRHYCDDFVLNSVLSYYSIASQREQVTFTATVNLPAAGPTDRSEFAVVLSNALENAIHAAQLLERAEERYIHLTLIPSGQQLFLEVVNSCLGMPKMDPVTGLPQASGEAGHGIGTRSISAYARKHHADLIFDSSLGRFSLRMLLPL